MVVFRSEDSRRFGAVLAAFAMVLFVLGGLLAAPAQAQDQDPEGIVVDFAVDVKQGECGGRGCAEDRRPVTFDAVLSVNEGESVPLDDPGELETVNGR